MVATPTAADYGLRAIQDDLAETRINLVGTVTELLQRGERLVRLEERSHELVRDAATFHNAAAAPTASLLRPLMQHASSVMSLVLRLATCNYICRDVYEVYSDSGGSSDKTHSDGEPLEMRRGR